MKLGEVQAGSPAAGIFGRCTAAFEVAVRAWFARVLRSCDLEYQRDIKAHCKGVAFDKTTLGNLIARVERAASLKPECVGPFAPSADIASLLNALRAINDDWVQMKHREEIGLSTILARMKSMDSMLAEINARSESRGGA